ncbi:MAG: ParB/RepB/Spo0J family partition protein [Candidatus Dormibacteria bacterium]
MAMKASSLQQRKRDGAARLLSAVPAEEIMGDLVDTVHDRILIEQIRPNPHQPRQGVDEESQEFADLVGSIRQQGLIQPVSLWQTGEHEYVIIAGERRWRAFRRLAVESPSNFARIPATVTRLLGDNPEAKALMLGLIENVVRQDLRDGERADALARLKATTGWTYEDIAHRMGLDVSRVQALASIARHEAVKDAVTEGRLTQKQAVAIGQGVPASESDLAGALVNAVANLSPQEARSLVRESKATPSTLPAGERVRRAQASVLVPASQFSGSPRAMLSTEAVEPAVSLNETSLRVLRPAVATMSRAEFEFMIQRVCDETRFWPVTTST